MKLKKALKTIKRKGKVVYGTEATLKTLKEGRSKLVIVAENTPEKIRERIQEKKGKTPMKTFHGTSLELGETFKRPHILTTVSVTDLGGVNTQEIDD